MINVLMSIFLLIYLSYLGNLLVELLFFFIKYGTVLFFFDCRNFSPTSPICGVLVFYYGRFTPLAEFHIQEL